MLGYFVSVLDKKTVKLYNKFMRKMIYNSYFEAMEALKKEIIALPPDLDQPKLILVPEVYTFVAEREFYKLNRGSFDVRVCSFSKLYYELCPSETALSRNGAIALVRRIVYDKRNELQYYVNAYNKRGFATKIYETIEKLTGSGISPDRLESDSPALNRKLADIRIIYSEYLELTNDKMIDSNGRTAALERFIRENNSFLDGSMVFVVNFDVFTVTQKKLLETIDRKAAETFIYGTQLIGNCKTKTGISVYAADNKSDEYKYVAASIRNYMLENKNHRYEDVYVLGENIAMETLKRVFDENEIPFYYDNKRALSVNEIGRFVLAAADCASENFKKEYVIRLSLNRFALPDKAMREEFLYYVTKYGVDFGGFLKTFDKEDAPMAEFARVRITSVVSCFFGSGKQTAGRFVSSVRSALETIVSEIKTEEDERIYQLVLQSVNVFASVYGNAEYTFSELSGAFKETLDSAQVSVIPNETDTVFVGPLNARRGFLNKRLFIVGFNDGVLPKQCDGLSLISDEDVEYLGDKGIFIEPNSDGMNERFRDELLQLLHSSEIIGLSYVSDEENKKSYLLRMIERENDGGLLKSDRRTIAGTLAAGSPDEIAKAVPTKALCLEAFQLGYGQRNASSLYYAVKDTADRLQRLIKREKVCEIESGIDIKSVSASSLQTWFDCPKKHFLRYVLGIKKSKTGEIEATDIGTLLHKTVEIFVRRNDFSSPAKTAAEIVLKEIEKDEKYALEKNGRLRSYVIDDAVKLCECVARQLTEGSFACKWTELRYGEGREIDGVKADGITLNGQIDRVDVNGKDVRVIDYKTGYKPELNASDIYYGKKLQLPIYSAVLKNAGYNPVGMYYFPVNGEDDPMLKGYTVDDDTVLRSTDYKVPDSDSDIFEYKADKKNKNVIEHEQFDALLDYAVAAADKAVSEMRAGYMESSPIESDGRSSVCDYCDFRALCDENKKTRTKRSIKTEEILKAVRDNEFDRTTK